MTRGHRVALLCVALVLGLLLCGPAIVSRALANIGLVVLTRALAVNPKAPDGAAVAEAEQWLEHALAWDQANPGVHRGLAWTTAIHAEYDEAAAAWQAGGLTALDLISRGDHARRSTYYQEALWWYQQAVRLDPELMSCVAYLEYLALSDGGGGEAAQLRLQEAVSLDRGWLDVEMRCQAWHRWGRWLYEQEHNSEAERALHMAIEVCPQAQRFDRVVSESYRLLGLVQWNLEQLEQAVQTLEKAIQFDGRNAWAHVGFGKALYRHDDQRMAEVEQEFTTALTLEPADAGLWQSLIQFWLQVGEDERAASLCLQAQRQGLVSELKEVCSSL